MCALLLRSYFGSSHFWRRQALSPDVITCSAAISACEKGSQPQKALSLLVGIRRQALSPDVITCSATISACEKGSRPPKALRLLVGMRRDALSPDKALASFVASRRRACRRTQGTRLMQNGAEVQTRLFS